MSAAVQAGAARACSLSGSLRRRRRCCRCFCCCCFCACACAGCLWFVEARVVRMRPEVHGQNNGNTIDTTVRKRVYGNKQRGDNSFRCTTNRTTYTYYGFEMKEVPRNCRNPTPWIGSCPWSVVGVGFVLPNVDEEHRAHTMELLYTFSLSQYHCLSLSCTSWVCEHSKK